MQYEEYKKNYNYICEMNDLRERMVQDFVITPFLRSVLPKCDIIPVDIKVSNGGGRHDYGKYCGKRTETKYWTPDLCIAKDWRWNNTVEKCPATKYIAVVEIKSIGDDAEYIISNTNWKQNKTLKILQDIGRKKVRNEIKSHLSANQIVIFTDGVTWYFFEQNKEDLEKSKAEMFELGTRIIDKEFDHIEWLAEKSRYEELKDKIKTLFVEE